MKPKFRAFIRKSLPALIIIPAMTQMAQAAAIVTAPNGSLIVTPVDNGANHIVVNGGVSPIVEINADTLLTPDAGFNGIIVNSLGYFDPAFNPANPTALTTILGIRNAGIITGALDGLNANGNKITFHNTGTIAGTSLSGVGSLGVASVIANSGTINGVADGIFSPTANDVIVHNTGTINGDSDNDGAGSGIILQDGATIVNTAGTIKGGLDGIFLRDDGSISNALGASIIGDAATPGSGNGITYRDDTAAPNATVDIANYGSITGFNGVVVGDNVTLHNLTSFNIFGPIAGGVISGASNGIGISGGNNVNVLNENLGTITGTTGNGVKLLDAGLITNNFGGSITSINEDAVGLNFGTVINDGSITGGAGAGDNGIEVDGGGATTISNTGGVSAFQGIAISGVASDSVTNSGTITGTGGVAITTGDGIDNVNLNLGSIINGSIDGETGSDTLTFNGGKIAPFGTSNVVHGNVTMETITKSGAGTAFIGTGGDPLYTVLADTINLDSGGLYIKGNVDGVLAAQTTIFHNGASLGGTGTWDANITLGAATAGISAGQTPINIDDAVDPLSSIGELTITGDVTHTPGSFIRFDIAPQTALVDGVNSDRIVQNGVGNVYDVNGAAFRISPTNINKAINNGTYTIVDSGESIANFNSLASVGVQFNNNVVDVGPFFANQSGSNNLNPVLVSEFTQLGLADSGTNLVFTIEHNFSDLDGLTSNESSLGEAIDQSIGSPDSNVQDFIAALDYSDLFTVQETLASMSPDAYLAQGIAVVNSNYRLHRMTQEHLAAVRGGGMTMTTPGSQGAKGVTTAPSTSTASSNGNVWGAYSHDWQDYNGEDSLSDFDGDTDAFTAGFDWRVAPAWILGIVLDGSSSDFDGDHGDSEMDSFRGAIYGTWGESRGVYSDFLVGYGTHDMDMSRSYRGILAGLSGDGSTDASSIQALWTVGYTMGEDSFKHGPFAGLEYQNVDVDSFDESGPLPFSMGSYDVESFRGLIGYRLDAIYDRVRPYASIAYAHEFEDDGVDANANFAGNSFSVNGAAQGSAILLTTGVGFSLTELLSMDVGYRGEISVEDEGLDSHGASVGLNYLF
jgi:uncharacterized protein YhjY with autotransporter beta-barrel domain